MCSGERKEGRNGGKEKNRKISLYFQFIHLFSINHIHLKTFTLQNKFTFY